MSSKKQLIANAFSKAFNKYFYNEMVIGKLAHSEMKEHINKGDEVDITMPGIVQLFDYDGGVLPNAEAATVSTCKVKIDRGKAFHFELSEMEEKMMENLSDEPEKIAGLAKDYTNDAIKQFASAVDSAYANLYTRAGHYLDDGGSAITLTASTAKDILAYMQAKFQRGDGKGHTNWIDGSMVCIIPPEYQFFLGKSDELKYTEKGKEEMEKGYIGNLCGWEILVSNNIAQPSSGVFYPLFGVKGRTLAGGISSDLNTTYYVPEKNFNTCYKGYGLYGVGAPRADLLGTVKISATLSV
ncbi:MAG: hypothetical protein MJ237_07455 [bacterium]|nr:hypothetical protein [bacterium]